MMTFLAGFAAGALFGYGTLFSVTLIMVWRNASKGVRLAKVSTMPKPVKVASTAPLFVEDSPGHFTAIGSLKARTMPEQAPAEAIPAASPETV